MPSIQRILDERVQAAIRAAFPDAADSPGIVQPSQDARFGDYQANGAMGLAKRLGKKPRDVAAQIVARLDLGDICEKPEIAGPGFINLRLRADWVAGELGKANPDDRLGVAPAAKTETIVVDYSGPNIAKTMHVGHLRSTIIGDGLARMLLFAGHKVIRQNHFGDWGTNLGAVILGMWHNCMAVARNDPTFIGRTLGQLASLRKDDPKREEAIRPICKQHKECLEKDTLQENMKDTLQENMDGERIFHPYLKDLIRRRGQRPLTLAQLEQMYQLVVLIESLAKNTGLTIPRARDGKLMPYSELSSYVASMMQHVSDRRNVQERRAWALAKRLTKASCREIYSRIQVLLDDSDFRAESWYRKVLSIVEKDLDAASLTETSQGAKCVFLPGFTAKDGSPLPLLVKKANEGYLYATTDLAAIRFRAGQFPSGTFAPKVRQLQASRILYVVDARQALHFQMVFAVARKAGFAPDHVKLEHVAFGTMMGQDGKPFKTREGGTVKLMDLLDEAEKRAYDLVSAKSPDLADDERKRIARIVGIGAVKYADLAQNRTSDYVFSWEKMLSLDGNTAPYMQYAYARIQSIFGKGGHEAEDHRADPSPIRLEAPQELALGKMILRLPEVLDRALDDYRPNVLAAYLYDLAQAFTAFYDACPVIQSEEPVRTQRLKLCDLVARTIARGLGLLGIETAERM